MKALLFLATLFFEAQGQRKGVQELCNTPSQMQPLTNKIILPQSYKISGSVTNWIQLKTTLLTETATQAARTLSLKTDTEDVWINDLASNVTSFISLSKRTCDGNSTTTPQLIDAPRLLEVLHNDANSLAAVVKNLIKLSEEHTGFLKGGEAEVVGGVETVTWISCINGSNTVNNVVVEARYAGENTVHPAISAFGNPLLVSIRLSEFKSFNDTKPVSQVSIELDRYEQPTGDETFVDHGMACVSRAAAPLKLKPADDFSGVLVHTNSAGQKEIIEILYSAPQKVMIVAGDLLTDKITLLNVTGLAAGTSYLVHDFHHGYELQLGQTTCNLMKAIPTSAADVVLSNNSQLKLRPLSELLVDPHLQFSAYPSDKGTKSFRAIDDNEKTVVEVELDAEDNFLTSYTYKQGTHDVVRSLQLISAPASSIALTKRMDDIAGCFSTAAPSTNMTISMEVTQKTMKDVYAIGVEALDRAVASSIGKIGVVNENRVSTFWSENTKGDITMLLRVEDKFATPPADVGFDYNAELDTGALFEKLNASIATGKWSIFVPHDDNVDEWAVEPASVAVFPDHQKTSFVGYTGGSMFVLAIFTFLLGVAIGAGGVFFATKRQRISTLAYQVFE